MKKTLIWLLLAILIVLTIAVDLRWVDGQIIMTTETVGAPRVIELWSILTLGFALVLYAFNWNSIKIAESVRRPFLHISLSVCGFFLLASLFCIFKPAYAKVWRTAIFIPSALMLAVPYILCLLPPDSRSRCAQSLLLLFYITISFSSLIVVLSAVFDIDTGRSIKLYGEQSIFMRRMGWGQDVSYQSCYSLFGFCFGMFYYFFYSRKLLRIINSGLIILNIYGMMFTGSRTGYVALGVVAVFFLIAHKDRRVWLPMFYLGAVALLVRYCFLDNSLDVLIEERAVNNSTMSLRDVVWKNDFMLFLNYPIFGVSSFEADMAGLGLRAIAHSQSAYFELLFMGGIFTLAAYINMFWQIFRYLYNRIGEYKFAAFTVLIVFAIFSTTEILFFSAQCNFSFTIIMGLLIAYGTVNADNPQTPGISDKGSAS